MFLVKSINKEDKVDIFYQNGFLYVISKFYGREFFYINVEV